MITIAVYKKSSGKPVEGVNVALSLARGVTHGHKTDSEGEAHFDVSPSHVSVFVDGSKVYDGRVEGRKILYV